MRVHRTMGLGALIIVTVALAAPVAAQSDDAPPLPAGFTGRLAFGDQVRPESVSVNDGVTSRRGGAWAPTVISMSDPRLDGAVTISWETDEYPGPDGSVHVAGAGTWRITTDDGAWQGSYAALDAEGSASTVTTVLTGEGAYEGLVAIWEETIDSSGWDILGVIYPAPPPDPPTAP